MFLGPQDTEGVSFTASAPVAQTVKNPSAVQKTQVQSLGQEDPLEVGMATHSNIFAWRIPWTEEPGVLQSMRSQSQTELSDRAHTPVLTLEALEGVSGRDPCSPHQTLPTFPRGQVRRHPSSHTSLIEPLPSWGHRPEPHSQPASSWSSNCKR